MRVKKLILAAGVAVTAAVILKRRMLSGGVDFERLIESMPDDAPPKWMFRNITAIRENTDRILELLEDQGTAARPKGPSGAGP